MRYASFVTPGGVPTWGAERDGLLFDLGSSGAAVADSLKSALAHGGLLPVDEAGIESAPSFPAEEVRFLPLIPDPAKILCVGVNYRSHLEETGRTAASAPTIFTRFADSQLGHREPAVRPASTTQFDYEGELAVIIGRQAHLIAEADAWDVVAGYSVYNDFSVRDWQRATTQWTPGKNFPATGGFGPYLVLKPDVPDVNALRLQTRVNGEIRQSASVGDLVFQIPQIISFVAGFTPLSAGDVIVTGTPGGVGLFMDPPGLLSGGDVVEVEITSVGTLTNAVVQG